MTPHLEITTRVGCRIGCPYCPQSVLIKAYFSQDRPAELTLEYFKTCLDKVPPETVIHFSGFAEPFLNSACIDMILYAYERGHVIDIFSTLEGVSLLDLERIVHIPFNRFVVHLLSVEAGARVNMGGPYFRKLDFVKKRIRGASFVHLGWTLCSETQSWLRENEGSHWRVPFSTRANHVRIKGEKMTKRKPGALICERGVAPQVLLPNGDVVLCCMDYGLRHKLGNLLSDSYEDLCESAEFKRVQKGMEDTQDASREDDREDILCRYCDRFAINKA